MAVTPSHAALAALAAALLVPPAVAADLLVTATPAVVLTASPDATVETFAGGVLLTGEAPAVTRSPAAVVTVTGADDGVCGPVGVQIFPRGDIFAPLPLKTLEDGRRLLVAPPGDYVAAVSSGGVVQYVPITIPGEAPDGPVDPPPGEGEDLAALSARLAAELDDPPRRKMLRAGLAACLPSLRADGVTRDEARLIVRRATDRFLAGLPDDDVRLPWYHGFRVPLNAALAAADPADAAAYADAVAAVVKGLAESETSPAVAAPPVAGAPRSDPQAPAPPAPAAPASFRSGWVLFSLGETCPPCRRIEDAGLADAANVEVVGPEDPRAEEMRISAFPVLVSPTGRYTREREITAVLSGLAGGWEPASP